MEGPQVKLIAGLLVLCCAAQLVAEDAPSEIKVEADGIRVVAQRKADDESMRAFNWATGTTVSLMLSSSKGGLIHFDPESSAIAKFLDGKGNDMLSKPADYKGFGSIGFSMFPKISADGKACSIEVNSPHLPAKGTTQIKLEGVITLLCATNKTEHVQTNVALKDGTKITCPDLELTINNVAKPDFGDDPLGLTIRSKKKLDSVAEIRFFKADGSEIKARRTGSSQMGIFGDLTVEWSYNFPEKVDLATVKVYVWSDLKKQKVPFSLDVGVGL
jgi:hypothetical protein